MEKKYYVLKPFTYNGVKYNRGDEFDAEKLCLHSSKINTRIQAGIIIEEHKLTSMEKAKLLRSKITEPKAEPVVEEKSSETTEPKAEPATEHKEENSLFGSNNVGGGKGRKNKN